SATDSPGRGTGGRVLPPAPAGWDARVGLRVRTRFHQDRVSHFVHPVPSRSSQSLRAPSWDGAHVCPWAIPAPWLISTGNVHGLERLRVADASIMPNILRANTSLTYMMIGRRVVECTRLE